MVEAESPVTVTGPEPVPLYTTCWPLPEYTVLAAGLEPSVGAVKVLAVFMTTTRPAPLPLVQFTFSELEATEGKVMADACVVGGVQARADAVPFSVTTPRRCVPPVLVAPYGNRRKVTVEVDWKSGKSQLFVLPAEEQFPLPEAVGVDWYTQAPVPIL